MLLTEDVKRGDNAQTDEELLTLSLKNPRFFTVLVDRYEEALIRKARSVLHSQEDAEDVVQETFTKAYLYAPKFKDVEGASFKSWIYKILMNTSFTRYQKLKKQRGAHAELDEEIYAMLPDKGERFEEELTARDQVISVLVHLPESFSRILSLYYLEGKSQQEIADEEGASVGAIKTRMHRAKKAFKEVSEKLNALA